MEKSKLHPGEIQLIDGKFRSQVGSSWPLMTFVAGIDGWTKAAVASRDQRRFSHIEKQPTFHGKDKQAAFP